MVLPLLLKLVCGLAKTVISLKPEEEQSTGSTQVGGGVAWFCFLFLHFTHFVSSC